MVAYVTQVSVTKNQPGICVGYEQSGSDPTTTLKVFRVYYNVRNQFGGKGRIIHMSDYGKKFPNIDAARRWCIDRGYLKMASRNTRTRYSK